MVPTRSRACFFSSIATSLCDLFVVTVLLQASLGEILVVGCWDQTLSFYTAEGTPHLKARKLHFYPVSLSFFSDGEFMVIGGSDKRATLCTREAVRLCCITEAPEWVWSVKAQPYPVVVGPDHLKRAHLAPLVATGCYGGSLRVSSLNFGLVHSLYKDRYAVRSNMTDVVVTLLKGTDEKTVRIKCRDYIKLIALGAGRLAVMLPDRISVWELHGKGVLDDKDGGSSAAVLLAAAARSNSLLAPRSGGDMHYKIRKEKIYVSTPVEKLLVLAHHLVIVHGNKIGLCAMDCGETRRKEREWVLESPVSVVALQGGLPGRETLLVGLDDGKVLKIFVDNEFPTPLVEGRAGSAVTCVSADLSRSKLAVVGADERLTVYDLSNARGNTQSMKKKQKPFAPQPAPELEREVTIGGARGRRREGGSGVVRTTKAADGAIDMEGVEEEAPEEDVVSGELLNGGRVLFSQAHITHACFNDEVENSLAFSGHGCIYVKSGDFPPQQQPFTEGNVVGYSGCKVHCLSGEVLVVPPPEEDEDDEEVAVKEEEKSQGGGSLAVKSKAAKKAVEPPAVAEGALLSSAELFTVTVPQTSGLMRCIDNSDFEGAHRIACLGATLADWRHLAMAAAQGMALEVAQRCAVRCKDVALLELLASISSRRAQMRLQKGNHSDQEEGVVTASDAGFLAELLAFGGFYTEAGKAFAKAGLIEQATDMFADLRKWDDAMTFAATGSGDAKELIRRQAEWNEETSDWCAAAEMFVKAGDPGRAVKLLGDRKPLGWAPLLAQIASDLPAHDGTRPVLLAAARHLSEGSEEVKARAVYEKLDAVKELMALLVSRQAWPEVVALAEDPKNKGKFDPSLFVPYAEWLALQDDFDGSLRAYRKAGRSDYSVKMMEQLTFNAVVEGRFKDAAFYYLLLSNEVLKKPTNHGPRSNEQSPEPHARNNHNDDDDYGSSGASSGPGGRRGGRRAAQGSNGGSSNQHEDSSQELPSDSTFSKAPANEDVEWLGPSDAAVAAHVEYVKRARLYFAYQRIEDLFQPFAPSNPDANFNVALFLLNSLSPPLPHGISMLRILTTLARSAKELGAYKLARYAYDKLHSLVVPDGPERDALDVDMLTIQAMPVRDKQELLPVCFLSGQTVPLLNPQGLGDVSPSCGHLLVRSSVNYEVLPLVEFVPASGITDDEAIELIRSSPEGGQPKKRGGFGANAEDDESGDLFQKAVSKALASYEEAHSKRQSSYAAVVADSACLLSLRRQEVYVLRPRLEVALSSSDDPTGAEAIARMGNSNKDNATMDSFSGRGVQYCRFFRSMLADGSCPVAVSQAAGLFFMEEDLELALLKEGKCPFSRQPAHEMTDYGTI